MSKSERIEQPFTNDLGQVINVGDTVIAIAQGYNHAVKIRVGKYLGTLPGTGWRAKDGVRAVQVLTTFKGSKYNRATNKYEAYETERVSTLPNKRIYPSTIPMSAFEGKRL